MMTENVSLASIVSGGGCAGMLALLYTPTAFHFGTVSEDAIHTFDGVEEWKVDLASIYEARLFNEETEIHWRRTGETGRSTTRTKAADEIPLDYLLWGSVESVSAQWVRVTSPRTPGFWVPCGATKGQALKLTGMEIISIGVDGNAYIAGERLTGLALAE